MQIAYTKLPPGGVYVCEHVCAWFPAVDWHPNWGKFSHFAPSVTLIGSHTDKDKMATENE